LRQYFKMLLWDCSLKLFRGSCRGAFSQERSLFPGVEKLTRIGFLARPRALRSDTMPARRLYVLLKSRLVTRYCLLAIQSRVFLFNYFRSLPAGRQACIWKPFSEYCCQTLILLFLYVRLIIQIGEEVELKRVLLSCMFLPQEQGSKIFYFIKNRRRLW